MATTNITVHITDLAKSIETLLVFKAHVLINATNGHRSEVEIFNAPTLIFAVVLPDLALHRMRTAIGGTAPF